MLAKGRGAKIRAPRRGLTKEEVDFDQTWGTLSTAFTEIHSKNSSRLSFEELFRNAYKLVLKKKQDVLYDRVVDLEKTWLKDTVSSRISTFVTPALSYDSSEQASGVQSNERRIAGERFIRTLKDAFADHQLCMGMITDVLMYMDRVYSQDQRRPSIYAMAMTLFLTQVLKHPLSNDHDVLSLLETVLLDMIEMERKGEVIDRTLVRSCCFMLEGLYSTFTEEESSKLYLRSFEPKFLKASIEFYRLEGQSLVAEADASSFCSHAQQRLKEEEERCQQTISPITEPRIKRVVDEHLILAHIADVINMEGTGVKNMLDNDKVKDLANVYDLIARVDPQKLALKTAVQKRVVELGEEINKAASVPVQPSAPTKTSAKTAGDSKAPGEKSLNQQTQAAITWVEQILDLKKKYDRLLIEAFKKDATLSQALEVSFQDFINDNEQSPEHLSLFLDEYLKRGGKDKTEAEIDALLDDGILLLQYLANKDKFETYYKKHMAKRLLMKKSVSRDMERQVLSKMKVKIGNQFTQKLEGLIRDTELSDNLNALYKEQVTRQGEVDPKRIDLDCRVLTTTVWPFETLFKKDNDEGTNRSYIYPAEIESVRKSFQQFYLSRHNGRKLTWMPSLGDADMRAVFTTGGKTRRYEINVSTYGMMVLMLFNDLAPKASLSFEQIQAETNIETPDLIRNLQSLSLVAKWRVLKKEPMSKDIKPTDCFFFNEAFSSQFLKIKVSVVAGGSRVENSEERRATQERIDNGRALVIEAAIVRIMKSRKNLTHGELMNQTLEQVSGRFQPDVNMIKKRIESLIDREYLERGADLAKPSYVYMA
ncbi:hypothetical protein PV10_06684 [Exophiala mesophila]|uniref:Cullin family profile domain-containing protein n=1 Tax=Exophiala mesophila TaxID=212818 RepID=A0A0D1XVB9_EXOME|nr:uncharacterized protein PV10_06684 [Exophiala mesophila]KIV92226.1 hypothetical protein PV10_06684 [Exophiala mesophila]